MLIYNGNTDLGRKHFMEALRLNPDYVDAQRMIKKIKSLENQKNEASDLFKEGKLEEAYAKFTECLNIDPLNAPYNATIYMNRAIVLNKQNKKKLKAKIRKNLLLSQQTSGFVNLKLVNSLMVNGN